MKLNSLLLFFSVLFVFGISSCKEDEDIDWKILNENWYNNITYDKLKVFDEKEFSISQNVKPSDIITTSTGLKYFIIHQGLDRNPNSESYITIKYSAKLIDGTEFARDSASTILSYMPKGIIEGVKKMKGGSHYIFFVPSSLGYQKDGTSGVPAYSTLIYDIKLTHSSN